MGEFEIVEVPPEIEPLFRALTECGIRSHRVIAETIGRLTVPPESLALLPPDRTELANAVLRKLVPFNGDLAARIQRLDGGQPDPTAQWKPLSRAERKRTKRLWDWALDASLDTSPRGRPPKIDAALVVYCARIIAGARGDDEFKFSRSPEGGAPRGPGWRALMAALPLAQSFLARVNGTPALAFHEIGGRAEAVADIVKTARSPAFKSYCKELGIGTTADDVTQHPGTFRLALVNFRARRGPARRK